MAKNSEEIKSDYQCVFCREKDARLRAEQLPNQFFSLLGFCQFVF